MVWIFNRFPNGIRDFEFLINGMLVVICGKYGKKLSYLVLSSKFQLVVGKCFNENFNLVSLLYHIETVFVCIGGVSCFF